MPYGDLVTRSFAIWWRHKYLWLLGLLGGGASAGFLSGGNYDPGQFSRIQRQAGPPPPGATAPPDFGALVSGWVTSHVGLIEVLAAALTAWTLAFLLLSCLMAPALIEATAWHDGDRPYTLRQSLRAGRRFYARVLVVKGATFLTTLAITAALSFWLTFESIQADKGNQTALAELNIIGPLASLLGLAGWVVRGFEDVVLRVLVLERRGVLASVRDAFTLVKRRPGRLIVVLLLEIALLLGLGVVFWVAVGVVGGTFGVILIGAFSGGSPAAVPLAWGFGIAFVVIVILLSAPVSSFASIYWTVAFRRLDWERRPPPPFPMYPYAYPYQAPSQQA